MKRKLVSVLIPTILVMVCLGSTCNRCRLPVTVVLTSFNPVANLCDDCDSIRLTAAQPSSRGPGSVVIRLANGAGSPWWKEIRCQLRSTTRSCGTLHANDGPSTASGEIFLAPDEIADASLTFTKPKTFGVATDVYVINDLTGLTNQTALFTWERDRCP